MTVAGSSDENGDPMQFQKDQLFEALRSAMPAASHAQLLAVVRAIDSFTAAKALEVLSQ